MDGVIVWLGNGCLASTHSSPLALLPEGSAVSMTDVGSVGRSAAGETPPVVSST